MIWARLSVSLVRNEHGEPLHFVSQIQDISAQRSSEQRLFESERSRITLDAVADLVLSVSLDGRIDTPTPLLSAPSPVMARCRWQGTTCRTCWR